MSWTKRKEILTSYEDIINYLGKKDNFHDYRIGNIEHTVSSSNPERRSII